MYPSTWLGRSAVVLSVAFALLLLGCDAPSRVLSSSAEFRGGARGPFTLSISPGNFSGGVGDSLQYTVTVLDRLGRLVPPLETEWSVSDPNIASISADGMLVGRAPGTTQVTVATYARERSVPVSIIASVPSEPTGPIVPPPTGNEPVFTAGVHTSLWHDDFESSTSTASIYSRYNTMSNETGLHLDATGGRSGSKGMRIEWQTRAGCTDDSHIIEGSIAPSQEVVVQYSVRYQAGFVFDWLGRGGPCGGNAKKLFFLWSGAGSRFDFISENHVLGVGSDLNHPLFAQNVGTAVTPEALGDGQWHRITLRVRQSSTPTATDGYVHGWIDGVQRWNINNIASNASGGWVLFKVPATFNQGSPVQQSEWMDDFRIWRP